MSVLSCTELSKRYGKVQALDSVSFSIEPGRIVGLLVKNLEHRLAERGISLTLTPAAVDWIVEEGYDPQFGARPMKRLLQAKLETLVARKILAENLPQGSSLTCDADETGLKLL